MIVGEISAGDVKGLGYTYGDTTVAHVITRTLAPIVAGRDVMRALHLAEVLDMAIRERPGGPVGAWPERRYAPTMRTRN